MDPVITSGRAAALWVGLLLILLVVLSGLVVRQRRRHKVMIGDGGVPELVQASRAFGNAVEYATPGMAALATLAVVNAPLLAIHLVGGLLFLGRVAHAASLSGSAGPTFGRSIGMLLTWLAFVFAGAALLFYAIG
ncbi:glutathione S-transferase [Caulobacter sp. CCUG 60055]|uniref:MAPEG family protein n=1 Tax=Caulobacter sp. CCUG 60055 TaxID=2100090 RepID=UPI001FA78BC1|nr:MAPEG family protein [Caulobacter sp. CCUG 60055]MBQ1542398.1 MAPEG family protein [Caulobacteraceae bacterium]MCI3181022.1 glutathione S-transferase [Caulobacter sp. CCUG 60055]